MANYSQTPWHSTAYRKYASCGAREADYVHYLLRQASNKTYLAHTLMKALPLCSQASFYLMDVRLSLWVGVSDGCWNR